ncbi:hypothetical protein F0562_015498 [Nyssa sinensis]|uniref:Uncharacterized protein n=1 Tax=Nyssa sinensis TaxID=561372 RepID=A0A5J4ZLR3_9ASTE|nr:hypothetical protein F0562_015498 [Nyssa sinensis]
MSHTNTIPPDQARFRYAIGTSEMIDAPSRIFCYIPSAIIGTHRDAFPFRSIMTGLLVLHHTPLLRTDFLSFPKGPFSRRTTRQSQSHNPAVAPPATHPEDDFLAEDLDQPYIPKPPVPDPVAALALGLTVADLDHHYDRVWFSG